MPHSTSPPTTADIEYYTTSVLESLLRTISNELRRRHHVTLVTNLKKD